MDPKIAFLFSLIEGTSLNKMQLEKRSGVSRRTFPKWQHSHRPLLQNFEALLGVFGYHLEIVKDGNDNRDKR